MARTETRGETQDKDKCKRRGLSHEHTGGRIIETEGREPTKRDRLSNKLMGIQGTRRPARRRKDRDKDRDTAEGKDWYRKGEKSKNVERGLVREDLIRKV